MDTWFPTIKKYCTYKASKITIEFPRMDCVKRYAENPSKTSGITIRWCMLIEHLENLGRTYNWTIYFAAITGSFSLEGCSWGVFIIFIATYAFSFIKSWSRITVSSIWICVMHTTHYAQWEPQPSQQSLGSRLCIKQGSSPCGEAFGWTSHSRIVLPPMHNRQNAAYFVRNGTTFDLAVDPELRIAMLCTTIKVLGGDSERDANRQGFDTWCRSSAEM